MATAKRRKLSAKQIKAGFGGKRRKAAAKSSRPKHRARTKKNSGFSVKRKVRARVGQARNFIKSLKPHKKRSNAAAPRKRKKRAVTKRRKNPTPSILLWGAGNPAKRRTTKVAKRRKKRATAKRSNTAGRRRAAPKRVTHRRRRSNPGGLGRPMDWVQGGVGVIVGVVGTRVVPQMLLGASNTGGMGYAANAAAAIGLGYLTHMMFPQNKALVTAVVAGGFAGLLSRVITDKTPFGQQLSLTGLGDYGLGLYQKSNFLVPQRIQNGRLPSPGSSMFYTGTQQGQMSTVQNVGADSMAAC